MLDYSSDLDSEIFPDSGECSFWQRGEICGATTCNECGADAAAALVANAAASLTGVVVAARQLAQEGDDPHGVSSAIFSAFGRRFPGRHSAALPWLSGLWDAAAGVPPSWVTANTETAIYYALGRIAFLAWRNAREENRRV